MKENHENLENQENQEAREKKDSTGTRLCISISGYVLLWLTAVKIMAVLDATVLLAIITFASIGAFRGGIKEFFSFFGVLASFLFALHVYPILYSATKFNFGTGDSFWGKAGCFFILLGIGWGLCRFLAHYLENRMLGVATLQYLNRVFGGSLGGLKGIILGYVFIMVMMGVEVNKKFQTKHSHAQHYVQVMENRHHFLENLETIKFSERLHKVLSNANKYFKQR